MIKLLMQHALYRGFHGPKIVLSYEKDFHIKHKKSSSLINTGKYATTHLQDQWIIKTDTRNFFNRIKLIYQKSHCHYGYQGVIGEAWNTFVANKRGFPCHKLCGLSINLITGHCKAYFKKTEQPISLEEHLKKSQNKKQSIKNTLSFLYNALDLKIYHGDTNISNIRTDQNGLNPVLIDLELAIPLNCHKSIAFALQCASLYDHRAQPLIKLDEYKKEVTKLLAEKTTSNELAEALKVFDIYTKEKRVAKKMRLERLATINPHKSPLELA